MFLHELNDDVLLCIVSAIATDQRHGNHALFSLTLTCQSLSKLARPLIGLHVSLGVSSRRFKLFKRTLRDNPSYGHRVLSFERSASEPEYPKLNEAQLKSFLYRLPNLRTLHSLSSTYSGPSVVPSLLSRKQPLKHTLQDIILHDVIVNIVDLFKLVLFPHLRRLRVETIQRHEIAQVFSPLSRSGARSELQALELGEYIGPCAMKTILLHCANSLKELSCPVPVDPQWIDDPLSRDFMLRIFSPMQILPTLLFPLAQTLTKLHLDTTRQDWLGHDGSRLDLSSFVALKNLRASALCFVAPLSLRISRNGLYRFLPSSLEEFRLDFGFDVGIFYSADHEVIDQSGWDRFLAEDIEPLSYKWITELAEHKNNHLPGLKKVMLCEENSILRQCYNSSPECRQVFSLQEWDPPLEVDWAFDEVDVELLVLVRSPISNNTR